MFIKTLAALKKHSLSFDRAHLAQRLSLRTESKPDRPFLMIVEQPGVWLYPSYSWRAKILEAAVRGADFDASLSGIYYLDTDSFSSNGAKKSLSFVEWSSEIGEIPVLSRSTRARFEHRSYRSAQLSTSELDYLLRIFCTWDSLADAASISKKAFYAVAAELKNAPKLVGSPAMVRADGRRLSPSYESFSQLDLERTRAMISRWKACCTESVAWPALWSSINGTVLGEIRSAAPLWHELLRDVESPYAIAAVSAAMLGARASPTVLLAVGFEADGKLARISYDLERRQCVQNAGTKGQRRIDWEDVRNGAIGRFQLTGFGSYVALAARGGYLILDPRDPVARFQKLAYLAVKMITGMPYPWLLVNLARSASKEKLLVFNSDYICEHFLPRAFSVGEHLRGQFIATSRVKRVLSTQQKRPLADREIESI
jgi:hypothetical protein